MRISGQVATNGMLMLNGYVSLKRHNIEGMVSFLVDTGADVTTIMPKDAQKMGIDYSRLGMADTVEGVGGPAKCYDAAAIVSFLNDDGESIEHRIFVEIIEPDPRGPNLNLPSLLGRDVINEYRMVFDAHKLRFCFDLG